MGQVSGEEHDFLWKAVLKGAKECPSSNCQRGEIPCTSFMRLDFLLPWSAIISICCLGCFLKAGQFRKKDVGECERGASKAQACESGHGARSSGPSLLSVLYFLGDAFYQFFSLAVILMNIMCFIFILFCEQLKILDTLLYLMNHWKVQTS